MSLKRLRGDLLAYGLMSGLSKSISILMLPILTRLFSTEEYGIIDIIATFSSFAAVFMSLTIESAVMRFWHDSVETNMRKSLVSVSLLFILGIGCLSIVISCLFASDLSQFLLDDASWDVYVIYGVISALFMSATAIPSVALRMKRKIFQFNLISIVQVVLYVGLTLLFVYQLESGLIGVFQALIFSQLISFLFAILSIRSELTFNLDFSYFKPSLNYSLPMFPAVFVTWLNNQVDRLILLMFMGLSVVGIYASAVKVAGFIALLVTVFEQAWSPIAIEALKKSQKERDEFYKSAFNYYFIAMFSLGAVIVIFGKHIMEIVVPPEYWSGYVIIPWIIGARVFHGAACFTGLGAVVSKRTGVNSIAAWSGAIVNLMLGYTLVPVIGINGAAIGSFVAELLFMLLLWRYSYRKVGIKFNIKIAATVVLAYVLISLFIII